MIVYIASNFLTIIFFLVFTVLSIRGRSIYMTILNIFGVVAASLAILLEVSGSFVLNMEFPNIQAQNLQTMLIFLGVIIFVVLVLDFIDLIRIIQNYNKTKYENPATWRGVMEGKPYKMIFSPVNFNADLEKVDGAKMTEKLQALQMWKLANQSFILRNFDDALEKYDLSNKWIKTSTCWLNKSGIFFEKGNFNKALKCTEEALQLNNGTDEIWINRGLTFMALNQFLDALQSFEEALAINAKRPETYTFHGNALKKLGKIDLSIASYDSAIKLAPEYLNAWFDKGLALTMSEFYEEAADCFRQTLKLYKKFALGHYYLANTLNRLDWNEEAIVSYRRALKINPGYHEAWNNLGIAQSKLSKLKDAVKSYDRAISIKQDYQEAWLNQALCYESLKKYHLAIESYLQYLKITPSSSNKHREIAQMHMVDLKARLEKSEKDKVIKKTRKKAFKTKKIIKDKHSKEVQEKKANPEKVEI